MQRVNAQGLSTGGLYFYCKKIIKNNLWNTFKQHFW